MLINYDINLSYLRIKIKYLYTEMIEERKLISICFDLHFKCQNIKNVCITLSLIIKSCNLRTQSITT